MRSPTLSAPTAVCQIESMKNTEYIFCVGNAVADVLARPVDSLAQSGTSQSIEDVALSAGGNCVNAAIALARLGVPVRIAAAIGDDNFGRLMRDRIKAEGIDDSGLVTFNGAKTSTSIVLIESTGERRFLHLRGVNAFFSAEHVDWEVVKHARFFHYASAFALPAFDSAQLAPALKRARELGCQTSINICWDTHDRWLNLLRSGTSAYRFHLSQLRRRPPIDRRVRTRPDCRPPARAGSEDRHR